MDQFGSMVYNTEREFPDHIVYDNPCSLGQCCKKCTPAQSLVKQHVAMVLTNLIAPRGLQRFHLDQPLLCISAGSSTRIVILCADFLKPKRVLAASFIRCECPEGVLPPFKVTLGIIEQDVVEALGPALEEPGSRDITFNQLRYTVEVPHECADDLFDTEMIVHSIDEVDVKALQEQIEADRLIEKALRAHRGLREEAAKPRGSTSSKGGGKGAGARHKDGRRSRRRRLDTCFMRAGEHVGLDAEDASSEPRSSDSDEDAREWVAAHSATMGADYDEARAAAASPLLALQDVPAFPDLKLYKPETSNTVTVLKKPEDQVAWALAITVNLIKNMCGQAGVSDVARWHHAQKRAHAVQDARQMFYMEDDEGCAMSRCHAGVDHGGFRDRQCGGAQGDMAGRRLQVFLMGVRVHVTHAACCM